MTVIIVFCALFTSVPAPSAIATPGAPIAASAIAAGGQHTCALLDGGAVKCWGRNDYDQLGLGDRISRGDEAGEMGDNLPVIDLGTDRKATALAAGERHTCALLDDATIKCWGYNGSGQLGLDDYRYRGDGPGEMGNNLPAVDLGTGRTVTAIAAGPFHTCAILDDATLKCWGLSAEGALGLGHTTPRGPGEMGDNLPTVDLGSGRTAAAVSAGYRHTCVVLDNGTVKCWGLNTLGKLGLGDTVSRGDEPGEMGDNLPTVDLGSGRTAIAINASWAYNCAVLDDATVKCWGYNGGLGQLGLGDTISRGDEPGEMGDNLPAVDLGSTRTATKLSRGFASHTCAHLDDGSVKCWGHNFLGQLGLGDNVTRGSGSGEMGDNLAAVDLGTSRTATSIAIGSGDHTCALLDDRTIKCWGKNDGQLGLGDVNNRGAGPDEMGDNLPPVDLGSPACTTHGYPDVPAWVEQAVNWAHCGLLMSGYPDMTFRSDLDITRGQLARLLYRVAGTPDVSALPAHGLPDVPSWIEDPVRWLVANSYMTGYPDRTFRPDLAVSRGQVTRATYRTQGSIPGAPTHGFADVPGWLTDSVSWATWDQDGTGPNPPLMTGYPSGTFGPDRNITRAETARLTCRANTTPGTC